MSALPTLRFLVRKATPTGHGRLRERIGGVVLRLADGPPGSTVHDATSGPAAVSITVPHVPVRGRTAPHAHWHTVTGPEGRRRLEATWH
ncbi:hypothetical protein ACFYZ9_19090 [Streptomyces sp. NPDC001691]|uniref:hypothetical protein n=1 Tax=unclassified Streptomyces TaxID=2593676 RepID=UPI000DEBCB07|nr:hypothetical protein [Streptomyces sp. SDr-06]RCH67606.1 hypothetical protein DT019_15135 [Streptomyces sp. SDr-06]